MSVLACTSVEEALAEASLASKSSSARLVARRSPPLAARFGAASSSKEFSGTPSLVAPLP